MIFKNSAKLILESTLKINNIFRINQHKDTIQRNEPFQDGGRYHIETSPLIYGANQWSGFYMIRTSVLKGLMKSSLHFFLKL